MNWDEKKEITKCQEEAEKDEGKAKFEAVEALPILGLLASAAFMAVFIYLAHP